MAQPTPYVRQADFTDHSTNNPEVPHDGTDLDAEFNAVKTTLDQTLVNIALIQRDDGALKNGIVTQESLALSLQSGFGPPLPWVALTAYKAGDKVWVASNLYVTGAAHTSSSSFATDLAALKWTLVLDMTATVPDVITAQAEAARDDAEAARDDAEAAAATVLAQTASVTYLWCGNAGGTANTLVLTPAPNITSYVLGHKLRFLVNTTNTGAVTVNTNNALGSRNIRKVVNGTLTALKAGDLTAGLIAEIEYISDAQGYQLLNPMQFESGNPQLDAIAATTSAANKLPYFTGSGTATTTDLSAFGRTLIDDADATTARTTLGITNPAVRQIQHTTIGLTNGTTLIPFDTSIPTNTEGTQICSLAITPVSATNKVRVTASFFGVNDGGREMVASLFRGSTCIAVCVAGSNVADRSCTFSFNVVDSPATTSATTYSIRFGLELSGNWRVNTRTSGQTFGDVGGNNALVLEEIIA